MSTRTTRRRGPRADDNLVLGLLLGGALGLAAAAMANQRPPQQRLVVGGIDLTNIDPTRPFVADFSVGPRASNDQKRAALTNLKNAVRDLTAAFPNWLCKTHVSIPDGQFALTVTPVLAPMVSPAAVRVG